MIQSTPMRKPQASRPIEFLSGAPKGGIPPLGAFFAAAREGLADLEQTGLQAALGRIRGTGPGASFSTIARRIRHEHPIRLQRPFESCESIAGGVWRGAELLAADDPDALLTLQFDADARELPMHQHVGSDRFIVVLEGRGFFHVTSESYDEFTGERVVTTAVRERDVVVFRRGTMHTFSTAQHPMTLLSFHHPYIPLEDEGQYSLPAMCWTAHDRLPMDSGRVQLEPTWCPLV